MKLDDAASYLAILGDPQRLRIYSDLARAGDAGLAPGQLQERLGLGSPSLQGQLEALREAGLIDLTPETAAPVYKANYEVMHQLVDFLLAECCTEARTAPPVESLLLEGM